jgi:hypothetical protein
MAPKPADKPGSVSLAEPGRRPSLWGGGCPPSLAAYPGLGRDGPPRIRVGTSPAPTSPLLGLAPGGGCLAARVAAHAGGLLHRLFTITPSLALPRVRGRERVGAVCFSVALFRRVTPPGHYPAPCPVEPGLSSPCERFDRLTVPGRDRLAGLGAAPMITRCAWVSRALSPLSVTRL